MHTQKLLFALLLLLGFSSPVFCHDRERPSAGMGMNDALLSGISGTVLFDFDGDCIGDVDSFLYGFVVQAWQNGSLAGTTTVGLQGVYSMTLDPGDYLITVQKPSGAWQYCPDTIPVSLDADPLTDINFTAVYNPQPLDEISGYIFEDVDGDCIRDPFEEPRAGWPVVLVLFGGGAVQTFTTETDANGYYLFDNLNGMTNASWGNLSVSSPQGDGLNCSVYCNQALNITFPNGTSAQSDIGVHCDSLPACPIMDVSIAVNALRPCFASTYHVNYCNIGALVAENASVELTIDPALQVTGSSVPWSSVNGNTYTFNVGDLTPEQCGTFSITVFTPCNDPVGLTYCSEAHGYPDAPCAPAGLNWDGSQIEVTAACTGGEVSFTISNIGLGNMTQPLEYVVVEDNVLLMQAPGSFQLNAGTSQTFTFQPNGAFLRMEADQSPGFPGFSMPAAWVEGCTTGSGNVSLGFVNQYALNDQDPWLDVFCLESVASFDPNDKQGFPRGVGSEHFIGQNTEIEYMVRFQNTGTASAINVEIRDTIPVQFLDPSSVRPGAASHAYGFDLQGDGVVVFKFADINLPDSNANEAASHGFVKFLVSQRKDVPLGTKIENTAAILFDFNAPVITNQTLHTIGENFVVVSDQTVLQPDVQVKVTPNPMANRVTVNVEGLTDTKNMRFQLLSAMSRSVLEGHFSGENYSFEAGNLPAGVYFYEIRNGEKVLATGKLVKM